MRYCFIDTERVNHSVTLLCKVMEVSKSSYYASQCHSESPRAHENKKLSSQIVDIHRASRQTYGKRRIQKELHANGQFHGLARISTLMKKKGIVAKATKKFKITTDSSHSAPVYKNLINQHFYANQPATQLVADITYIPTHSGFLYLAVVIDIYSRKVIGWSMATHMKASLVCNALKMAKLKRGNLQGCIHHSDQGCQYASDEFQMLLKKYGMICSMSRKGNCWDNSVAESFFHSLKVECLDDLRFNSHEEAKLTVFDYIEVFYNQTRRHSYLGYLSPNEFEARKKVA